MYMCDRKLTTVYFNIFAAFHILLFFENQVDLEDKLRGWFDEGVEHSEEAGIPICEDHLDIVVIFVGTFLFTFAAMECVGYVSRIDNIVVQNTRRFYILDWKRYIN